MFCIFSPRKRYVKAMMKAIDYVRTSHDLGREEIKFSKTMGLRVIKRFERVNKCAFNPFDNTHILLVCGMAGYEVMLRKLNKGTNNEKTRADRHI